MRVSVNQNVMFCTNDDQGMVKEGLSYHLVYYTTSKSYGQYLLHKVCSYHLGDGHTYEGEAKIEAITF